MNMQENGNKQLLTSWKEIAAHLGKGVRTVQRWERELGLPVRRPAQARHIVVALSSELDEWVGRLSRPASQPCCSSRAELEIARQAIAQLQSEIARLESEKNAMAMAVGGAPVSIEGGPTRRKASGEAVSHALKVDENAA